jgi:hypothetical protein
MNWYTVPDGLEPLLAPIRSKDELIDVVEKLPHSPVRDTAMNILNYPHAYNLFLNSDVWWQQRELIRRSTLAYPNITLWNSSSTNLDYWVPLAPYFVHRSLQDKNLVAYTPNTEYGLRDRQVSARIGKLLKQCQLDDGTIKEIATGFAAENLPFQLNWAEGAEEIERVYLKCGTQSCMSKEKSFWAELETLDGVKVHPVHVYDCPDIGCAYVTREKKIVARALVNRKTNQIIRIYGNEHVMLYLLAEAGITGYGSLEGVRLKRIDLVKNRVLVPYLDGGVQRIRIEDDALVVDPNGLPHPNYTVAAIKLPSTCANCGGHYVSEDHGILFAPDDYCSTCINPHQVWYTDTLRLVAGNLADGTALFRENTRMAYLPGLRTFYNERLVMVSSVQDARSIYVPADIQHLDAWTLEISYLGEQRRIRRSEMDYIWNNGTISYSPLSREIARNSSTIRQIHDGRIVNVYYPHQQVVRMFDNNEMVYPPIYCTEAIHRSLLVNAVYKRNGARTLVSRERCVWETTNKVWIIKKLVETDPPQWDERLHYVQYNRAGVCDDGLPTPTCTRVKYMVSTKGSLPWEAQENVREVETVETEAA